jgi:hypothetical protein
MPLSPCLYYGSWDRIRTYDLWFMNPTVRTQELLSISHYLMSSLIDEQCCIKHYSLWMSNYWRILQGIEFINSIVGLLVGPATYEAEKGQHKPQ